MAKAPIVKNKGSFQIYRPEPTLNANSLSPSPPSHGRPPRTKFPPSSRRKLELFFFRTQADRFVRRGSDLAGYLTDPGFGEGPATIRMDNGGALPGLSPLSPTPLSPSSVQVRTPSPPLSFLLVVVSPDARTRVRCTALHPTSPSRFSTRRRRTWRGESKSST